MISGSSQFDHLRISEAFLCATKPQQIKNGLFTIRKVLIFVVFSTPISPVNSTTQHPFHTHKHLRFVTHDIFRPLLTPGWRDRRPHAHYSEPTHAKHNCVLFRLCYPVRHSKPPFCVTRVWFIVYMMWFVLCGVCGLEYFCSGDGFFVRCVACFELATRIGICFARRSFCVCAFLLVSFPLCVCVCVYVWQCNSNHLFGRTHILFVAQMVATHVRLGLFSNAHNVMAVVGLDNCKWRAIGIQTALIWPPSKYSEK